MCWSWRVSLFSAVINTIPLYLIFNGIDERRQKLSYIAIPVVLQEYIQFLQWLEIDGYIKHPNLNIILSNIIRIIVNAAPLFWSYALYSSSDGNHFIQITTFRIQLLWFIWQVGRQIFNYTKVKTKIGEHDLLQWPKWLGETGSLTRTLSLIGYLFPSLAQFLFYKPIQLSLPICIIAYSTLINVLIKTPDEWGAFWCITMTFISYYIQFYDSTNLIKNLIYSGVYFIIHFIILKWRYKLHKIDHIH